MFWDFIYQFNNSFGWEWLSNVEVCIFKRKIKEERKNKAIAYTFSFF